MTHRNRYKTLVAAQRAAAEAGDDVDAYLEQSTAETCRHCGQQNLRRFEVLNDNTCERCRLAYPSKKKAVPAEEPQKALEFEPVPDSPPL